MKLLKWIFFKGPILALILFVIYATWSYFRPHDIPDLISWWNTPKVPKVDSAGKPITRGPNEEPEPVRKLLPAIDTIDAVPLTPGQWYSFNGVQDGLFFDDIVIKAYAPILIRRYKGLPPNEHLLITRLQKPDGKCDTYDEKTRKVIKPVGGVESDIRFTEITRYEIGSEQPGVIVQIRKTRSSKWVQTRTP